MALQNSKLYESLSPRDKRAVRRCIEATVNLKKAKKLFEDGDQAGAVDAIADAETQLGAADAIPGVSEEVKANIQGVQNSLDQLKTVAGIQEVDPNQGQAEAGIPPVETAAGTDMVNQAAPAPIQESNKITFLRKKYSEARSSTARRYYLSRIKEETSRKGVKMRKSFREAYNYVSDEYESFIDHFCDHENLEVNYYSEYDTEKDADVELYQFFIGAPEDEKYVNVVLWYSDTEGECYIIETKNDDFKGHDLENFKKDLKKAYNNLLNGKVQENSMANYYKKKITEAKTVVAKNYYREKYNEAIKSNSTVQSVLNGSFVPNDVTSKIKFKNNKENGKPALEQMISKSEAHNGTDKGRVRWPNKKITDLESRANTNMNRVIQYTRKKPTMKESTEGNPMMNSVQKLTESENRAIDRYLGKGKFNMSQLKDLGMVEA